MIMNVGGGQTTGSLDLLDLICMALKFPDNIIIIAQSLSAAFVEVVDGGVTTWQNDSQKNN